MSVKMRQEVERKIATAAIQALLKAGFAISIDNGGDTYERSTSEKAILENMFQTDEEHLYVEKPQRAGGWRTFGWLYFVYGNDGWDVLSDYTVNLEKYVGEGSEAYKISEYYSD
jgi:hypothetical protein